MAMPKLNKPHLVNTGDVFGRLVVIDFSHNDSRWRRHYKVECSCGNTKTVQGTLLRSGNTRSCGCLYKDAGAAKRIPDYYGLVNQVILQYKRHARDRGIDWLLERDFVDAIIRKRCYYCGVTAGNLKKTKNDKVGFAHNGIDRVDSSMPYIEGNVVPCCGVCNKAKGTRSKEEFLSWAKKIAEFSNQEAKESTNENDNRNTGNYHPIILPSQC
jgi:hypothetical protein